jgi:ribosomal protein L16 Arg81 hydroxylase
MIYMPRGWWHVAFPLDEPSLHLTMTIVPATGADLLTWSVDALKKHPEVRMNVPEPASPAERKEYVSKLRELILEHWDDDVLDRFLAEWNGLPVRPQLDLPHSPAACQAPITMETRIRLATTAQLLFLAKGEDAVSFHANGVWWDCSRNLVPALNLLRNDTSYSVGELCAHLSEPAAAMRFVTFLTVLAMGGAIWIEPLAAANGRS